MKKTLFKLVMLAGVIGALTLVGGCSKNQQKGAVVGTLVGAGLGAGIGGLIGNSMGSTGAGVAIGAIAGGATGAAVGATVAEDDRPCREGKWRNSDRCCRKGEWRNCSMQAKDACCPNNKVTIEDVKTLETVVD